MPLPPFRPHPFVRGGHAQTVAAVVWPGRLAVYRATRHQVRLTDGDVIVLHDDVPDGWPRGGPAALLVHGLAGCHLSPYMVRVAAKLNAASIRTFRIDLRDCGAGQGLAQQPYHAGKSEDVLAALAEVAARCPESDLSLVGFSLGGNLVLKLLGQSPADVPLRLRRAAAVNPPIDLVSCARRCGRRWRGSTTGTLSASCGGSSRAADRTFPTRRRATLRQAARSVGL